MRRLLCLVLLVPMAVLGAGPARGQSAGESRENVAAEVVQAVLEALAHKLEVTPDAIEVVQSQPAVWPDGAMGCAQPGREYLQAQTRGYRIVLVHAGKHYDYRATGARYFFLCQGVPLREYHIRRPPPETDPTQ